MVRDFCLWCGEKVQLNHWNKYPMVCKEHKDKRKLVFNNNLNDISRLNKILSKMPVDELLLRVGYKVTTRNELNGK